MMTSHNDVSVARPGIAALAVATVILILLLNKASASGYTDDNCAKFLPPIPVRQDYNANYAICLSRHGQYRQAVREFQKYFSTSTVITQVTASEASIYSSDLAEINRSSLARPLWHKILRVYFSEAEISNAFIDQSKQSMDRYGTALALHGRFREALGAFMTYARANIVGMRTSIFDDDRDLSDRIVDALEDGSLGKFHSCYMRLDQLAADSWDQYRSFYAGVCAQANGKSKDAQRAWLREARQFSICCGSTNSLPGNTSIDAIRMLYSYHS